MLLMARQPWLVGYSRLSLDNSFTKTSSSWITGTLDQQLHFKGERMHQRPQRKPVRVIALQIVGCFWGVDQCTKNKQVLCKAMLFPFSCTTLVWWREASQQQRARRPLIYNITSVVFAIAHQPCIKYNGEDTCLMQYRRVDNRHLRGKRGWEGNWPRYPGRCLGWNPGTWVGGTRDSKPNQLHNISNTGASISTNK